MKIYLIGLSGTGKSRIGKQLAKRLNCNFVDTDAEIERITGKSIEQIFEQEGESAFRRMELRFFETTLKPSNNDLVISTGGGFPCFHNLINEILEDGTVVHFSLPQKILISRLNNSYRRPLLSGNAELELKQQWEARKHLYSQAHIELSTMDWDKTKLESLAERLLQISSV